MSKEKKDRSWMLIVALGVVMLIVISGWAWSSRMWNGQAAEMLADNRACLSGWEESLELNDDLSSDIVERGYDLDDWKTTAFFRGESLDACISDLTTWKTTAAMEQATQRRMEEGLIRCWDTIDYYLRPPEFEQSICESDSNCASCLEQTDGDYAHCLRYAYYP